MKLIEYNASDFPNDEKVFLVRDIKDKIQELKEYLDEAEGEYSEDFGSDDCNRVIEKVFGKELTEKTEKGKVRK